MIDSSRTALVAGATGLVGGHVLDLLLAADGYSRVVAIVRRPTGRKHDKLVERVVDFDRLEDAGDAFAVSDVYACLGTTIKVAGSQERFRQVDHDYTVAVATLAKRSGATRLALVSSVGADVASSSFYLRVKGETERDVRAVGFERLVIARPSFLVGERSESRPGERVGIAVIEALGFAMLGGLRKYRAIEAKSVARAMIDAMTTGAGEQLLQYEQLSS